MLTPTDVAREAATEIRAALTLDAIDLVLVLGSGWSGAATDLGENLGSVDLVSVPGFSAPVVAGHGGEARAVHTATGATALILTGRTHFYEGRGVAPVVHGVHTAAALGAAGIVLTNGCGSTRPEWGPGTVVALRDHINLTGASPLVGPTFIDMTDAYSPRLRALAAEAAGELPEGVYAQFHGPNYETPAEVQMAARMGADLVGMSTALETIAARSLGLEVLGLSLVTNHAAGVAAHPLDHAEVLAAGRAAAPRLAEILIGITQRWKAS